jgi:DNA-binding transcriptional regulator YiaG
MDGLEIKKLKALATLKEELSELLMVSARAVQTWEDGSRIYHLVRYCYAKTTAQEHT